MRHAILNLRTMLITLWLLAVGAGLAGILRYENTGGQTGQVPSRWPTAAKITLDSKVDTLVMFAHPQCPCTRASIEELNRLLAKIHGRVSTHVLFFSPHSLGEDWSKTDLWRSAEAIPGLTVARDVDGKQAALFGAETSGYVLLYEPGGQLIFHGGITGSRGHAGDNAGENIIASLCEGQTTGTNQTPVYGCSLLNQCVASTDKGSQ